MAPPTWASFTVERGLRCDAALRYAVDRRGRGEDDVLHARIERRFEQRAAGAGVVTVILERLGDGFRNDRMRGEMHDRVDLEAREDVAQTDQVSRVADDQITVGDGLLEARRQVVENDDALARLTELADDMRADITGSAGDENVLRVHSVLLRGNDIIWTPQCISSAMRRRGRRSQFTNATMLPNHHCCRAIPTIGRFAEFVNKIANGAVAAGETASHFAASVRARNSWSERCRAG